MSYMKMVRATDSRDVIVIEKYYSMRYHGKNVERAARRPKEKQTNEVQAEANRRRAAERAALKIANNFAEGDIYLTLTYDEDHLPEKAARKEQADKDLRNVLKKIERRYQAAGVEFKRAAVVENCAADSKGRLHFHVLLPALPSLKTAASRERFFGALWQKGHVRAEEFRGDFTDAQNIANYFSKQKRQMAGARIRFSANCRDVVERKSVVKRSECYAMEIQVPPGYEVVKELTRQLSGAETRTGWPWQHIVLQRSRAASTRRRWSVSEGRYRERGGRNG